jgi:hypothetical protein
VGAGEVEQGLTDRLEEEGEQEPFVGQDEGVEEMRQGEDEVEVAHGQKLCRLLFQPPGGGQALLLRRAPIHDLL